jgi:hypothetical protein
MEVGQSHPTEALGNRTKQVNEEIRNGNDQRVKDEGVKARQQGQRIHEECQRESGQGGAQKEEEQKDFNSPEGSLLFEPRPFLLSEKEKVEEIDRNTHGAEVAAEEPANGKCSSDDDEGPEGPTNDLPGGKNSRQTQERIEAEIDICRKPVGQLVSGKNEEDREEKQGQGLDESPQAFSFRILS